MSHEKKLATITTLTGLSLMILLIWIAGFCARTLPTFMP